jgi:hypothetical protein
VGEELYPGHWIPVTGGKGGRERHASLPVNIARLPLRYTQLDDQLKQFRYALLL